MATSLFPELTKPGFLYRFEIFLPIFDNEGELIDPDQIREFGETLTNDFGGVTINYPYGGAGGVDGIYRSSVSQILYKDSNSIFLIFSSATNEAISYFKKNLKKWESEFRQEKILVLFNKVQYF